PERLLGEERRTVRKAHRYSRALRGDSRGVESRRVVELDAIPLPLRANCRIGRIGCSDRCEALRLPRIVAGGAELCVENRYAPALLRGRAEGNQHAAAAPHVLAQAVEKRARERRYIGE